MEFKKREEYSINRNGDFYQISQDEFVHCSLYYNPETITWMKGNKRKEQQYESATRIGVVGNSFFFKKDRIIKKAEIINYRIVIKELVKIENGIKVLFKWNCLHYFIERNNNKNVSFAIPINEDYRTENGIQFNVSIDELKKYYQILVHKNFLFGITDYGNSSSIRRYQSDSEEYLEKKELPDIWGRFVIFSNWIFYLTLEGSLISVNMYNLSYEIIKTNLEKYSHVVGIDENGMVNVQTNCNKPPVHLLTAQLPEKYINQPNMPKLIDTNKKRIEELERKVETEQKEKEELLKTKNLLEKRLEIERKDKNELEKSLADQKKKEEELERRLVDQKKKEEELERRLVDQKKKEEELERRLEDQKKKEEELERRLVDQKKKEEELERRIEDKEKKEEELERRLVDQKKKEEELERRLEDKEKKEEELERRLVDQKKKEEELERRLEDQKKKEEELERRLEDQKKKEEELERRLEDKEKKEEELERRLEDKEKKEEELERRLVDQKKKEEELEKRNAITEMEMKELQQKYNKLLVRISKWDEKK